ncbi:alpha/beta fold hydrolase [Nakamurella panacisegetis]|uniref:alpha/beta fold hydrolase n=1 Tax=Nakamurella panacisegetis TaxID=1090615 RepID=UPI000AA2D9E5|nr:alpha/beta hydrolase [Nakamurella panacisegetis]
MKWAASSQPPQQIKFCNAPDGVRIAYAVHGRGPALLISTCWLSHLQFDWQSPVWRHFLIELGKIATVVRFDERGHGLSDWDVTDHSFEARVGDLEAVADAAGFSTFALMGMAQGGPVSVAYAVRHPERVTRMLFYGSFSNAGRLMTAEDRELDDAFEPMIKAGWARPDSTFRRVFTSLMIPAATEEQMTWLDDLQRMATSASTAVIARQQRRQSNVDELLGELRVPTLVLHATGDRMNRFEFRRELASGIAGARLVALPSDNHIVLQDEPAWPIFVDEVDRFLEEDRRTSNAEPLPDSLSERELQVLQ